MLEAPGVVLGALASSVVGLVTSERLTAPVDLCVALSADQLKVCRVVSAAMLHLDDVVHLQAHRRPQELEVILLAHAVPAMGAHGLRKQVLEALIRFPSWLAVFRWLRNPEEVVLRATD
jgi:hypothetical protein